MFQQPIILHFQFPQPTKSISIHKSNTRNPFQKPIQTIIPTLQQYIQLQYQTHRPCIHHLHTSSSSEIPKKYEISAQLPSLRKLSLMACPILN
ncbi:hypothetical protein H5410_064653 [Solanum commersonii]|uniref:Uncharacterized protein n=1 Tax=Solanum commersonii TaxID=4109 RepID=A0A9J5VYS1_SOLCO|nr:hypothetical protein H5410_064653 [Solanum commersonii]